MKRLKKIIHNYLLFYILILGIFPFLISQQLYAFDHSLEERAPRPDAPAVTSPFAIVGPGTCDLSEVIRLLNILIDEEVVVSCSTCACDPEFQETWTILADLKSTVSVDFNQTWTILADLKSTISVDFNETWTILAEIISSLTCQCQTEFQETWTILADLKSTVSVDFNQTWTILADLKATVSTDFMQTWTILAAISSSTGCQCLTEFQETWTILSAILGNECAATLIRQTDFGPAGDTTYVISTSGAYKLAENITFSPATSSQAILITASNVTLDLQCYTLNQGNTTPDVDGIYTVTGNTDILIENGKIESFSRAGISVQSNVLRIGIRELTCLDCGVRGIEFLGGPSVTIRNAFIDNVDILLSATSVSAVTNALYLESCENLRVTNLICNNNGIISHDINVIEMNNCFECLLENVIANDNIASQTINVINLISVLGSTFKDCTIEFNEASGTLSTSRGFVLASDSDTTLNKFINCTAVSCFGNGLVDGFFTGTACEGNLFLDCESRSHTSFGAAPISQAHGFNVIDAPQNTFQNCLARNIEALSSTAALGDFGAYGFDLNTTSSCLLLNCTAIDIATGASSNSVGIRIFNGIDNGIQECLSARNSVGYSLDPDASTAHFFTKNVAGKNTTLQYRQFPVGSTQTAADVTAINGSLTNPWSNVAIG